MICTSVCASINGSSINYLCNRYSASERIAEMSPCRERELGLNALNNLDWQGTFIIACSAVRKWGCRRSALHLRNFCTEVCSRSPFKSKELFLLSCYSYQQLLYPTFLVAKIFNFSTSVISVLSFYRIISLQSVVSENSLYQLNRC